MCGTTRPRRVKPLGLKKRENFASGRPDPSVNTVICKNVAMTRIPNSNNLQECGHDPDTSANNLQGCGHDTDPIPNSNNLQGCDHDPDTSANNLQGCGHDTDPQFK